MNTFKWKDVDLNLLVAFQALYRASSVSIAAEQCFVSQSAMSHTLQRLRALFNDRLFNRVGSRMEPTVRANELAPQIDALLSSIENKLFRSPNFSADQYQGVWKIGLTDYAELLFAPTLFDRLKEHSPLSQVSFYNVNRSNYQTTIEKEQIDLMIGSITAPSLRFFSHTLYTEQHLCLFDPKVLPFKQQISLEEFISIEHALVSPDGKLQTVVDQELAKVGLTRKVGVVSKNFLTLRHLLPGRKLICIVPKRFAEDRTHGYPLRALPAPVNVPDFDIQLLGLKTNQNAPRNIWLQTLIKNMLISR